MNIEEIRSYCIEKNDVEESFPFGENFLVFKVKGKIFLILVLNKFPLFFNVKTEPSWSDELREYYFKEIKPAYHMNKKHWNSVFFEELKSDLIKKLINHSYELVIKNCGR